MRTATYHGRRARVGTVGSQGFGRRVVVMEWLDDATPENGGHAAGTVVARHMKGDGRTADHVVYAEQTFDDLSAAFDWAEERLR